MAAVLFMAAVPSVAVASGDDFLVFCSDANVSCQDGVLVGNGITADKCATASADVGSTLVCVLYEGDEVYVYDGLADGHAALGLITASSGVASRYCRNPHGYDTWVKCNFDWAEDATKNVFGGRKLSYDLAVSDFLWSFTNN